MKFNYIRNQEIERLLERSVNMLNGYENIDRNSFFSIKEERRISGHGVTFAKKPCRLDIRKYTFS